MKPFLESIQPMPAAFDQRYVKRLTARNQKVGKNKCDLANQIRNDIAEFKSKTDRQVMIWCGSTEIYLEAESPSTRPSPPSKRASSKTTRTSPRRCSTPGPALKEGIPFANGAPNLTVDIPALQRVVEAR